MNSWKPHVKEESLLVFYTRLKRQTKYSPYCEKSVTSLQFLFQPAVLASSNHWTCFNAPFKKKVESAAMQHIYKKTWSSTSMASLLLEKGAKWVGQAWEELAQIEK